MTFDSVISEIKAGKFNPVYFLTGEESYFIDSITELVANNALSESERAFNQLILYGRDTDMPTIITSARRYPMMASRQVIIVKEAQQMRNLEGLESYIASPMKSTVLLFAYKYKKLDKRTKLAKLISEKAVFFESDKIREDKVPAWISSYLNSKGYQIDLKAASLMVDFLGNDLSKIINEIEKLLLVIPANLKRITDDVIEKNIGISKEFNNFELNRALVSKDIAKANRIIRYFKNNPKNNPLLLTISSLFYYFTKVLIYHGLTDKSKENAAKELGVNPFFVTEYQQAAKIFPFEKTKRIISWLREYDVKSKGGSTASDSELLKELIYKILH